MFPAALHGVSITMVGGALGWAIGELLGAGPPGWGTGLVLSTPLAVVGASSVARCRPYAAGWQGGALLAVDVTWSALNTWAGALFLALARARGNEVEVERSAGSARVHLADPAISGYATTVGMVVAGCSPRLESHEQVHVFQARLLGPLYLPLVGLGFVVATVLPYWLISARARSRVRDLSSYFVAGVYPHTWHEWWAYRSERLSGAGGGNRTPIISLEG